MGKRRKRLFAAAAAVMAVSLAGCSSPFQRVLDSQERSEWVPAMTAVEIHEDGTLTETILDTLDQTWYDAQELEEMISLTVEEYNAQAGEGHLTISTVSIEEGQVNVVLDYMSSDDYAAYNHITFFDGTMLNAQLEGYLFSGNFRQVKDGKLLDDVISSEEPLSHKEYRVVITDSSHEVCVPGKIVYVSEAAQTDGTYAAYVPISVLGEAEEGDSLYIIYEY